jgi:hypothetical protein
MSSRIAALLLAVALSCSSRASADTRPTSGDLSVMSGRTLGNGETALWFDGGFPGIRATAILAPSSRFNVGLRGAFLYASPYMGFGAGLGASFEAPLRFLVFARDTIDVSVTATPRLVLGQGSVVGEEGIFADDFGFGATADLGARAGFAVADRITLTAGMSAEIGAVAVPEAEDPAAIFVFTGVFGLEAILSMDVLLTLEATGGYGAAPGNLFDGHGVFRIFAGVAFLI